MLRMRTVWPTGLALGPNSLSTTVCPSTTTLVAAVDVGRSNSAPAARRPAADQEVVGRRAGDAGGPVLLLGDDLRVRPQLRRRVLDRRHLALDRGQVVPGERRHASRSRRGRRPTVVVPDMTMSRFEPIAANDCSTIALAPSPIATIAITAPTPMMMPSAVRNDRSLLRISALPAMRIVCSAGHGARRLRRAARLAVPALRSRAARGQRGARVLGCCVRSTGRARPSC